MEKQTTTTTKPQLQPLLNDKKFTQLESNATVAGNTPSKSGNKKQFLIAACLLAIFTIMELALISFYLDKQLAAKFGFDNAYDYDHRVDYVPDLYEDNNINVVYDYNLSEQLTKTPSLSSPVTCSTSKLLLLNLDGTGFNNQINNLMKALAVAKSLSLENNNSKEQWSIMIGSCPNSSFDLTFDLSKFIDLSDSTNSHCIAYADPSSRENADLFRNIPIHYVLLRDSDKQPAFCYHNNWESSQNDSDEEAFEENELAPGILHHSASSLKKSHHHHDKTMKGKGKKAPSPSSLSDLITAMKRVIKDTESVKIQSRNTYVGTDNQAITMIAFPDLDAISIENNSESDLLQSAYDVLLPHAEWMDLSRAAYGNQQSNRIIMDGDDIDSSDWHPITPTPTIVIAPGNIKSLSLNDLPISLNHEIDVEEKSIKLLLYGKVVDGHTIADDLWEFAEKLPSLNEIIVHSSSDGSDLFSQYEQVFVEMMAAIDADKFVGQASSDFCGNVARWRRTFGKEEQDTQLLDMK